MGKYTGQDYGYWALPFLILPSIYKPSFISIPLVLFKRWPGQETLMKNGKVEITQ